MTLGWWIVGIVVAVYALRSARRHFRRWYRDRYRREALARVSALQQGPATNGELIRELNTLLKLTAIAAHSRDEVASLTGEAWPEYLNTQCDSPAFDSSLKPLLASGSYSNPAIDAALRSHLFDGATRWIRSHRDHHA